MHTQLMEVDEIRIFNVSNVSCFQLVLTIIHIIITMQSEQRARAGLEIRMQFPSLIISMVEYERV